MFLYHLYLRYRLWRNTHRLAKAFKGSGLDGSEVAAFIDRIVKEKRQ